MLNITSQVLISNLTQVSKDLATFTLTNTSKLHAHVVIQPGSINKPEDRSLQHTVVVQKKQLTLKPGQSLNISIKTACYNLHKKAPLNMKYSATSIKDKSIKEGMTQSQVWNHVQQMLKKAKRSEGEITKLIDKLKDVSSTIMQKIQKKTIECFNAQIKNGFIQIEIQDPRQKGMQFRPPQDNIFNGQALKQMKAKLGKKFLPVNIVQSENGKVKLMFPTKFDQNEYFLRIDCFTSTDDIRMMLDIIDKS